MNIETPTMYKAVTMIKERVRGEGKIITEEEISQKINIPAEQLIQYMTDEKGMPPDLPKNLLATYGMSLVQLTHTITIQPANPPPDETKDIVIGHERKKKIKFSNTASDYLSDKL